MKPKLPEIVYKYRSWTNDYHKDVLLKRQVFLSPPSDFNDPFDCRVTKNHHLLNTPERIEEYIEKGIKGNLGYLISQGRDIEFERNHLRERLQNLDQYQKEFEALDIEYTDKYLGVLSLSERWNSILMWSHYGDFHKGYCLGFDEEIIRTSGYFGKGGRVTYTNDLPKIDPINAENEIMTSFYQTHFKAKDWEYEEEYRLTKLYFDKPNEEPNRVIILPENSIREVVIGLNTSNEHKKEIISFCKEKTIPVYQAKKEQYEFKLKRELIN
ncbi:DUF2971 domain-containing protein [Flagellimonas aequoris]|uniref:DUF2971 domain-containing protein n=1 Tax=Flagellimonas aequoris TaxID=2306997 RepID=A0A418NB96_9FLAO|nr:DUF2971 domain-containing protein [Allomuricauda aequoris]RIV73194.1 DUF2971 domain-containing protein [Allomuricauda aequoris]TXK07006.1 DUF2971 domain-containing protein [Allomuricauda aequoris]